MQRIGDAESAGALLFAAVIDYTVLCCQGFLTIRACRRGCSLTIRRLTFPYAFRSVNEKSRVDLRCDTRHGLCGRFKGTSVFLSTMRNSNEIHVECVFDFAVQNNSNCEEVVHKISINKNYIINL